MLYITMYLDFVSPRAWEAFEQVPNALKQCSYHIAYRPVLRSSLWPLSQPATKWQLNLAKTDLDRTYERLLRVKDGQVDITPAEHLYLLLLSLKNTRNGSINRHVTQTIFDFLKESASLTEKKKQLAVLRKQLTSIHRESSTRSTAAQWLRSNTAQAQSRLIQDLPAFCMGERSFFGANCVDQLSTHVQSLAKVNSFK